VRFNIVAPCIGVRAGEANIGALWTDIRPIGAPCPILCALAAGSAKAHATAQPRRMIFFEFITLGVHKIKRHGDSAVTPRQSARGNAIVTFSVAALNGGQNCGERTRLPCNANPARTDGPETIFPLLFKRDNRPFAPNFVEIGGILCLRGS
jgi:hypothetical protein